MNYNEDPSEGLTLGNLVLGTLTSIIALLTTLCNTISLSHLLVVVHRDRDKRKNSTTILYLNLGVCDVLQGIVSSLSAISLLNNRVLPGWLTWFCPVSAACVEILPSMSLFITMYVLGIKCIVFYMPLRSKQVIRYRFTLMIVMVVWGVKIIYSFFRQYLYGIGSDYLADFSICIAGDYFLTYNFIFMGGLQVNLPVMVTILFTIVLILKVRQRHYDRQVLMREAMHAVKKTRVTQSKLPNNFVAEVLNPLSSHSEPIILQCFTHPQLNASKINVNQAGGSSSRQKYKRVRAHSVAYTTHPLSGDQGNALPPICSASHRRSTITDPLSHRAHSWNTISPRGAAEDTRRESLELLMRRKSLEYEKRRQSLEASRRKSSVGFVRQLSDTTSSRRRVSSEGHAAEKPWVSIDRLRRDSIDSSYSSVGGGTSSTDQGYLGGCSSEERLFSSGSSISSDEDMLLVNQKYRSLKQYLQKKHSLVSIASIASKRPSRISIPSITRRPSGVRADHQDSDDEIRTSYSSPRRMSYCRSESSEPKKRNSVTLVSFVNGEFSVENLESESPDFSKEKKKKFRSKSVDAGFIGLGLMRRFSTVTLKPQPQQQTQTKQKLTVEVEQPIQARVYPRHSVTKTSFMAQQGTLFRVPEIVLDSEISPPAEKKKSPPPVPQTLLTITPQRVTSSVVQKLTHLDPQVVMGKAEPVTSMELPKVQYLSVTPHMPDNTAPGTAGEVSPASSTESLTAHVDRSPARQTAREQRLARRRISTATQVNSSDGGVSVPSVPSPRASAVSVKPDEDDVAASPPPPPIPTAAVDVIALKYMKPVKYTKPAKKPMLLSFFKRKESLCYDSSNSIDSPLQHSHQDLTYGTETERDMEAAQNFIRLHQRTDQPHIIPMWNKRPERTSLSDWKPRRDSGGPRRMSHRKSQKKFVKEEEADGGFDPLLRSYTQQAPYFINTEDYTDLTLRKQPGEADSGKARKQSAKTTRKDFVLLGLNLGGGFIERQVSKPLQKKMELNNVNQNSSGKSMRALRTSILVAVNISLFYSLFLYIWVINTLWRFTSNDIVEVLYHKLGEHMTILGPLYIVLLPTVSSMLDPVIYLSNNSGMRSRRVRAKGAPLRRRDGRGLLSSS